MTDQPWSDGRNDAAHAPAEPDGLSCPRGWLAGLPDALQAHVLSAARNVAFAPGEPLFAASDPADGLIGIRSGEIEIAVPRDDGATVPVLRTGPGIWLGDVPAPCGTRRLYCATACDGVEALHLPGDALSELEAHDGGLAGALADLRQQNMEMVLRLLSGLTITQSDRRVAIRLVLMDELTAETPGAWIPLSRPALASLMGLSVPTLQRTLGPLARDGLIELGYGRIRVIDRDGLRRLGRA